MLIERLMAAGYEHDAAVEVPGTYTRRGGIIDVYPPTEDRPIRLDFFGDEVESLRGFDPGTQASVENLNSVRIGPARESLYGGESGPTLEEVVASIDLPGCPAEVAAGFREAVGRPTHRGWGWRVEKRTRSCSLKGSFLEYLPKNAVVLLDGGVSLEDGIRRIAGAGGGGSSPLELRRRNYLHLYPQVIPNGARYLVRWKGVGRVARLEGWERAGESGAKMMGFTPTPNFGGHLRYFLRDLRGMLQKKGIGVSVVSHQAERLSETSGGGRHLRACDLQRSAEPPAPGTVKLVQGALVRGLDTERGGEEESPWCCSPTRRYSDT